MNQEQPKYTKAEKLAIGYMKEREWDLGDVGISFRQAGRGSEYDRTEFVSRNLGVPFKIAQHLVAAARKAGML